MTKMITSKTKTIIPVTVKKRLLAAASSTLTSLFFLGLLGRLIFRLAMRRTFLLDFKGSNIENVAGYPLPVIRCRLPVTCFILTGNW